MYNCMYVCMCICILVNVCHVYVACHVYIYTALCDCAAATKAVSACKTTLTVMKEVRVSGQ